MHGAVTRPLQGATIGQAFDQTVMTFGSRPGGPKRIAGTGSPTAKFLPTSGSWTAFPLTVTGKVQKNVMRQQMSDDLGTERNAAL